MLYFQAGCPAPVQNFAPNHMLFYDNRHTNDVRWNFEKVLIDRRGKPVFRYSRDVEPDDIADDIRQLLMRQQDDQAGWLN